MPNPFGTTFESLESPSGPVVDSVHEAPYRRLIDLIDSDEGKLISLRAPRAGYGKTMLLSRLREKKKSSVTMIPIHLVDGRRIEGERVLEEVLTQLTETVSGTAGLTKIDLHARRLFAHGLIPMVYSGEVPSQDKDGALMSLRERPTEAFDFHNDAAAIAQWTKSQFEVLLPRLSTVLGKASGAATRDASYWISRLFDYATKGPGEPSRTGELVDAVFGPQSRFRSGAGFLDGLGSFLNLVTLVEPTVLVLDEVDGLSSDSDAALRVTSSLISLWEAAPRVSVVISVNDDVWESAFAPRLPLGLRDRLEDVVIRLKPLNFEEAKSLVKVRSGVDAERVIEKMDLGSDKHYPRAVLKAARDVWDEHDFDHKHLEPEISGAAVEGESSSEEVESGIKEFSSPVSNGPLLQESGGAGVPVAVAKPTRNYPPVVVKRVSLPKAFDVIRIRPSVEPSADHAASKSITSPQLQSAVSATGFSTEAPPSPDFENLTHMQRAENLAASSVNDGGVSARADHNGSPVGQPFGIVRPGQGGAQESPTAAEVSGVAPFVEHFSGLETSGSSHNVVSSSPFQAEISEKTADRASLPPPRVSQATPFDSPASEPVAASQKDFREAEMQRLGRAFSSKSPFDVTPTATPVSAEGMAAPLSAVSQTPSPFEASPQAEPVSSPTTVAFSQPEVPQAPSPFEVNSSSVAQTLAPAPAPAAPQAPSPFEVNSSSVAQTLAPTPAPAAPQALSPFEVNSSSVAQTPVPTPAPAAPQAPSPFEVNSPALASSPPAVPVFAAPVVPQISSPFEAGPSSPPVAQASSPSSGSAFAESSLGQGPSPFEANLAPQATQPQPKAPQADSDAIDELLRQFREHREG